MEPQVGLPSKAPSLSRYAVALCFGGAIVLYALLIRLDLERHQGVVVDDLAWTLFSLSAALVCAASARRLVGRERLAWQIIAGGCGLWLAGQLAWDYYELIVGKLPGFPHWMQLLFVMYPLSLVAGLLFLPRPNAQRLSLRRVGNLGLLVCALAIVLILSITEPAAHAGRSVVNVVVSLLHSLVYALACLTALYLLWSYRWQNAYWPLLLIVGGLCLHIAAFIADLHSRMAATYLPAQWIQVAWLMSFSATACAAHEFAWSTTHRLPKALPILLRRERWLEASLPALLISTMLAVAVVNREWLSSRVAFMASGVALLFAVVLGFREAWVQREEQRLLGELNASRDSLLTANAELKYNEQQVRVLNAELERRVSDRTAELQAAYRELESFSYAVAHDIKAPLRAINGFGTLLADEYAPQLDERARGYIHRMRRGALHMAQLVDDLLAYARIERLELQPDILNLAAVVAACVAELEEDILRDQVVIELHIRDTQVRADRAALSLALRNLLQNAIKFSKHASPPRVLVRAEPMGDTTRLSVADNGIGFDMQYHDRIFALFQRLHRAEAYAGTGIGLAIARKAVERMGGRIWAQSEPQQGATFYIELPC